MKKEENKTLFDFYVDNNKELSISGKKQTEYKVLLSVGEHTIRLRTLLVVRSVIGNGESS